MDDLTLLRVVSLVRTCYDCCPACRAEAAAALGENIAHCATCGAPVLDGYSCPCITQALEADRIKIEKRALHENRPVAEIEAEFFASYERRSA